MLYNDILISQLKEFGLNKDDSVMLHASMRAVGKIGGGPDQIHQAIMEATDGHPIHLSISGTKTNKSFKLQYNVYDFCCRIR